LLENESDVAPGLKDVSEFPRVHAKVMLANLFIKLTFKVSPHLDFIKVGSHEEFFPVALVLGVKYPMHHNFLSIMS
jgi:hypothetical protein